jgi:uncharacterized protein YuzE
MKAFAYYPASDMLVITLREVPATGGGEDATEGVVFSYDNQDRLVLIEIDQASKRVDLTDIQADPGNLVDDAGGPVIRYTVSELARQWKIPPRTLQQTIQVMKAAGVDVGRKWGPIPNAPIVLSAEEAEKIKQWRQEHRRGRPAKKKAAAVV